jgi:D-sedoheptulose 7-phosphate isomerase
MTKQETLIYERLYEARDTLFYTSGYDLRMAIAKAAHLIATQFTSGHKLLLCGNGGSAAMCSHIAAEFTSRLSSKRERAALPALSIASDSCYLTAHINDYGNIRPFARLIDAFGQKGDILLAMSTSGGSMNVLHAIDTAHKAGLSVIGMFGQYGCEHTIAPEVDISINIPSLSTQHIQEAHLAVGHIIVELVEEEMFGALP